MTKAHAGNLYKVAVNQAGFFTTSQAVRAGYRDNVHGYHVRNGDWIRVRRGIYRLTLFPEAERPELIVAWLWSRNRNGRTEGVFSHWTALEIRNIAPAKPDLVHMTVPKDFRRNSSPPRGLVLHQATLPARDVEQINGLPVTSLIKTVADMQECGVELETFKELGRARTTTPAKRVPFARHREDTKRASPPTRTVQKRKPKKKVSPHPKQADPWGGARAW